MKNLLLSIETSTENSLDEFLKLSAIVITDVDKSQKLEMYVFEKTVMKPAHLLNSSKCKKNQLVDLQELLERYCNVLPVFGFNSAKNDINLIKSYLIPILINGLDIELLFDLKLINTSFSSSLETFS